MPTSESFLNLMAQLRQGDDAAARELFDRFARRLIGLARSQVNPRLLHKIEPEDVVQSVYRTFFRRHGAEQVVASDWDGLMGLLTVITVRKCLKRVEYFRAACRDARLEVGLEPPTDGSGSWRQVLDREPTPDEAAQLTETLEAVLLRYDPEDREVIELTLQGDTVQAIAARLGRAERSVRRLREGVRKRLERLLDSDEEE
jgi:RNA polymerase sigma-70 factor, ECF subfamily